MLTSVVGCCSCLHLSQAPHRLGDTGHQVDRPKQVTKIGKSAAQCALQTTSALI